MPAPKTWSADEDAALVEVAGMNTRRCWKAIARLLGRTVPAVQNRAVKIGVPTTKAPAWSAEDDAYLAIAWTAGIPIQLVAQRLGRTHEAIRLRALKFKIRRPDGFSWERKKQ